MIPAILFFAVLTAGPLFLSVRHGKRFEETIAVTTGTIILFMFVCGMIGLLKASVYIILGSAVILTGWSLVLVIRKKQFRGGLSAFFTPAAAAFFLAFAILLAVHYGRRLHEWDEFTHWGEVVKAMAQIDNFSTSPDAHLLFQSYVPGMSLFQYLFEKIAMVLPGGIFVDWRLYFSYHLLGFIFVLPFFTARKWKYFLPAFIALAAAAVSPDFLLNQYLTTIYVDGFLGLLAGTGLALLFTRKQNRMNTAHLLVILSMLVLSKDVGMLFAVATGIAYMVLELRQTSGIRRKENRKRLLILLALTAAAIAVPKILWEISITANQAEVKFREPIDFGVLYRVITGQEETYKANIPVNCFNRMLNGKIGLTGILGFSVTYPALAAALVILLAAGWFVWSKIDPEGKKQRTTAGWTMILVLVIYCLGMPLLYMFRFGETSSGRLASFDRYMSIVFECFIAMVLLLFAGALQEKPKWILPGLGVCLAAGLIALNPGTTMKYLNRESVEEQWGIQGRYDPLVQGMQELAGGEEKHVWIIAQETQGMEYWILHYGIRPSNAEINVGWSIAATTEQLYAGDHWTLQVPTEEWKEKLKNYDYVMILCANDSFREDYGSLFENPEEIGNNTIFGVDHERDLLVKAY